MRGVMEYHMLIPVGKATLHVQFSGGNMEGYGNTPAEYSTGDRFMQMVIEHCEMFKAGKIYLVREVEIEGDPEPVEAANPAAVAAPVENAPVENAHSDAQLAEKQGDSDVETVTTVHVTCDDDAKDYLVDTFGYVASKLRGKTAIERAAADHNITFVYD